MGMWMEYAGKGQIIEWPYPIKYHEETEIKTDVLVLGGGIAGCWAAIGAAKKGSKVVILEKGATIRSGSGGAGCDHWGRAITGNPCCPLTPEEVTQADIDESRGYCNPMAFYAMAQESYDTLLELEKMGAKVRDTEDEFKGAAFRDEKTKLLFAFDYQNKYILRVWGTTFKPVLYKECKRLGVDIMDRVNVTSLLTENGRQGRRVIGATGVNVRTGELIIVKAKATVLGTSRPNRIWDFSTEKNALSYTRPPGTGGYAMAWRAGATFTMMEKSIQAALSNPAPCQGAAHPGNTWFAATMVDSKGKEIPWIDRDGRVLERVVDRYYPAPDQKFFKPLSRAYDYSGPSPMSLVDLMEQGEIVPPIYADLTQMPTEERKAIFGLMVGEESKSKGTYQAYIDAGFDPGKDMLQGYQWAVPYSYGLSPVGKSRRGYDFAGLGSRNIRANSPGAMGGLVVDWNMQTTIEGLYAAGDSIFGGNSNPLAAVTGKQAGRKAAEFASTIKHGHLDSGQLTKERHRVYGPIKNQSGLDWKEFNVAINKIMQVYCGDPKNEELMNIGLALLDDLKDEANARACATDPHKLGRTLEVMDILTSAEMIIHASLSRKASSRALFFNRTDYPDMDPKEWHKFVTTRLEDGTVKVDELPIGFWGDLEGNYQKHKGK